MIDHRAFRPAVSAATRHLPANSTAPAPSYRAQSGGVVRSPGYQARSVSGDPPFACQFHRTRTIVPGAVRRRRSITGLSGSHCQRRLAAVHK